MLNAEKKVTVEWINENQEGNKEEKNLLNSSKISNPIYISHNTDNLSQMITSVLDKELPMLKNNSLLHDLVLYTLMEKMKTVQTVKNVLSYIKGNRAKKVQDVYFENGEVRIKCSV